MQGEAVVASTAWHNFYMYHETEENHVNPQSIWLVLWLRLKLLFWCVEDYTVVYQHVS
jgi:hypothetical protein